MLHWERKRAEQLAQREAAGESLWTEEFDTAARRRFLRGLVESVGYRINVDQAVERIDALVDAKTGLSLGISTIHRWERFQEGIHNCRSELMPTMIEATALIIEKNEGSDRARGFESFMNEVLYSQRIGFELINGQMIERASQELHAGVVAPTLRLLSGRPGWEAVETAYQKALNEIADDHPDDAITDAGTALQEALKKRGAAGNSLGPLARSARDRGLLAGHDSPMIDGIVKIIDGVHAARNAQGDVHSVSQPDRTDAWFIVHVVGALIHRLATSAG